MKEYFNINNQNKVTKIGKVKVFNEHNKRLEGEPIKIYGIKHRKITVYNFISGNKSKYGNCRYTIIQFKFNDPANEYEKDRLFTTTTSNNSMYSLLEQNKNNLPLETEFY